MQRRAFLGVKTLSRCRVGQAVAGFAVAIFLASLTAGPSAAQYVYPKDGQDQAQQDKDRGECHVWAVNQTGYDPTQASSSPPPSREAAQGGLLRGGARGAAGGAIIGAIAGNAGKGAAIGAATGGLMGGMRRSDQVSRQNQQKQNWQAQQNSMRNEYQRAVNACLTGRGYTVG